LTGGDIDVQVLNLESSAVVRELYEGAVADSGSPLAPSTSVDRHTYVGRLQKYGVLVEDAGAILVFPQPQKVFSGGNSVGIG
jgi:hypothetical protein